MLRQTYSLPLHIGGRPCTLVIEHKHRRHFELVIKDASTVRVLAPANASQHAILNVVREKLPWIQMQFEHFAEKHTKSDENSLETDRS